MLVGHPGSNQRGGASQWCRKGPPAGAAAKCCLFVMRDFQPRHTRKEAPRHRKRCPAAASGNCPSAALLSSGVRVTYSFPCEGRAWLGLLWQVLFVKALSSTASQVPDSALWWCPQVRPDSARPALFASPALHVAFQVLGGPSVQLTSRTE